MINNITNNHIKNLLENVSKNYICDITGNCQTGSFKYIYDFFKSGADIVDLCTIVSIFTDKKILLIDIKYNQLDFIKEKFSSCKIISEVPYESTNNSSMVLLLIDISNVLKKVKDIEIECRQAYTKDEVLEKLETVDERKYPFKSSLIDNIKAQNTFHKFDSVREMLNCFVWSESREGSMFWSDILLSYLNERLFEHVFINWDKFDEKLQLLKKTI